ncbi:MAG: bacterial Ig-like domain-containing protein [Clostridiales bacterium]|nr:bacterial Ig-like domain-containing protein [Clostridiales bacterium]
MNRRIMAIALIIAVFMGFVMPCRPVMADGDHSYVDLDGLAELADDPEALSQVLGVFAVAFDCDQETEETINLITQCTNVEYISICVDGLRLDKEFFNALSTNAESLTLSLQWGSADFEGVDNPDLTWLYLSENTVEHYPDVVGFENLEYLSVDNVTGFSAADYDRLSRLSGLTLTSHRIDDYQVFFQKIQHVRELSLYCCNLQNKDTGYLTEYMKELEGLNLYGTYVDDISFLKELENLKWVVLPLGVSNLDVLYEMPYLESITFEAYTELFVDDAMAAFFDENGIWYTQFDRDAREKVDSIIESLDIPEQADDWEKIEKITEYVLLNMRCEDSDSLDFEGTTLDFCLNVGTGVCHDYSTLEYTLLKYAGIDVYLIVGYAFYRDGEPGAHAWNEICIDGTWYGLDPLWLDDDYEDPTTPEYKALGNWKFCYMKPTKIDDLNDWPVDDDFSKCPDKHFPLCHRTMNDPMDTLGNGSSHEIPEEPVTVASISVETPGRTSYEVGDTLDVDGMEISIEYSDGTVDIIPVTAEMVTGFDTSAPAASQTLTITYEGVTTSYEISITVSGIVIPDEISYVPAGGTGSSSGKPASSGGNKNTSDSGMKPASGSGTKSSSAKAAIPATGEAESMSAGLAFLCFAAAGILSFAVVSLMKKERLQNN